MMKIFNFFALLLVLLPPAAGAQTLLPEAEGLVRAEVVRVVSSNARVVPGTETKIESQTLEVKILQGADKGKVIVLENDYAVLETGQKFFLKYVSQDGEVIYTVNDLDRRLPLLLLTLLFIAVIVIFGGWQGVRSLLSLIVSLLAIVFILLPALLAGHSPVLISSLVAVIILTCAIYATHGLNRQSSAALLATIGAVLITGLLAAVTIKLAALSGLASDEAVYLNLGTAGELNFRGLLLGAMIIGMLGVLDDIAVTQAAMVGELKHILPQAKPLELYRRALKVGREHVGALVNTLVLAYTASSLPLLLLFSVSTISPWVIINREIFAAEIVRTLVGSIGLVLTVPLSTILAVWLVPAGSGEGGHHHH